MSTLQFVARVAAAGQGKEIIARDKARAQKLMQGIRPHGPIGTHQLRGNAASATDTGVDVTDAGVTYTAAVGVGSPATDYTLLIDTGRFLKSSASYELTICV